MGVLVLACHGRRRLVYPPVDHNDIQLVVVLQDRDVLQRVAVNEDAVPVEALLDLAQLLVAHEELGNACRRCDERLHGRESQQLDEVVEIARVRSVGRPCKSIVASWEHCDASLVVHLP